MSTFWHIKDFATSIFQKEDLNVPQQVQLLLPDEIGCRIIERQMETIDAQNLNKEIIMNLVSQYNKAIQFYEERGSQKYLLYQKKLHSFLMRPSIIQVLQGKTGAFLLKKQKNEEELKKMRLNSHAEVKKLMESSQNSGKKQEQIVKSQLKNQQEKLQERIQRKRINSSLAKRQKYTTASFAQSFSSQKQIDRESQEINAYISEFVEVPSPHFYINSKKNPKKLAF